MDFNSASESKTRNKKRSFLFRVLARVPFSGGKRTRTADPLHAMQVLYQLSYTPETKLNVTHSLDKCRSDRQVFLRVFSQIFWGPYFAGLFMLLLCSACNLSLNNWQLKSQQTLLKLSHQAPLQLEPPHSLKPYIPLPPAKAHIIRQVTSLDKNGHQRLQLYIHLTQPAEKNQVIDHLVTQYKNDFDIIWFFSHPDKHNAQPEWRNEAAWFSPDIPKDQHYHEIKQATYSHGIYRQ